MGIRASAIVASYLTVATASLPAQTSNPEGVYKQAVAREAALRRQLDAHVQGHDATQLLKRVRTLAGAYEDMAKLFPSSTFSDDALWQAARLSADAFWGVGESLDRVTALRLFATLTSRFPSSTFSTQAPAQVKRLSDAEAIALAETKQPAAAARTEVAALQAKKDPGVPAPRAKSQSAPQPARRSTPQTSSPTARPAVLSSIRRELLPEVLRVTLQLERETPFTSDRIDGPSRVFVDLLNTRAGEALIDARLSYPDEAIRQIRVGRHTGTRTRVVLDLVNAGRHSVYTLYNPYRIVIDFERPVQTQAVAWPSPPVISPPPTPVPPSSEEPRVDPVRVESASSAAVVVTRADTPIAAPSAPSANRSGGFSLSRQLGLGIARVVIDPGHGGHDPGTRIRGLSEAELALDVALRLEKLLLAQPGVEVILTRRDNIYVPLEERTEMANRASADLFLSIHVNASASASVHGVETYFLNFAPNAAAEATAARENAGSLRTMRNLPDIVRAIALNNKIDESRDFAAMVQGSLYENVRKVNRAARNLGVKQAPFTVLIGATMPSVLAEIAFITNKQEASLLRTEKYRQSIADALFGGIQRYQQSLKKAPAIAAQ